jgi:CRISPR-associated endonuclease/helicase Cas3
LYIAHIDEKTGREQSVADHCESVSRLCRRRGEKIGLAAVAELLGLCHDVGKAREAFAAYILEQDPIKKKALHGKIDHSTAGAQWLYQLFGGSDDLTQELTVQILALTICSHHGGLIDCLDSSGRDVFHERMQKSDTQTGCAESVAHFRGECADEERLAALFKQAKAEVAALQQKITALAARHQQSPLENPQLTACYFFWGLTVRYLLSCLLDADRLDTACFERNDPLPAEPEEEDRWETLSDRLEVHIAALEEQARERSDQDRRLNRIRGEISRACRDFNADCSGIYRLYVPTGGGKTLSSLRFALHHAAQEKKRRIFYFLPYITIIEQNAREIRRALSGVEGKAGEELVLEHHSNLLMDDDDDEEAEEKHKLLTERWDAPIVLTTTVQFFNALFLGKTQAARRLNSLADAVLIFDEVQSLPVECLHLFNLACNFLSEICGATIVLCTATQPRLSGLGRPLLYSEPADLLPDYRRSFDDLQRTDIVNKRDCLGYDSPRLRDMILGLLPRRPTLLTILNTKKAAQQLYECLREYNETLPPGGQFHLFYLSTGLCARHRLDKLDTIRRELKQADSAHGGTGPPVVCVTTQLIEAGVDISFDCVIRSWAGLDNIAQAAGRCNRHGRHTKREVYVINSTEEDLTYLKPIAAGGQATFDVLPSIQKDGCLSLAPEAIDAYFQTYYHGKDTEMDYPVFLRNTTRVQTTLIDLLSLNRESMKNSTVVYSKLPQSFQTAGRYFSFIDQDTVGLIVPYRRETDGESEEGSADDHDEDGAALIDRLRDPRLTAAETFRLLRRAQRYTVNVFRWELKQLPQGAVEPLPCGALALSSRYYDPQTGLVKDLLPMSCLLY